MINHRPYPWTTTPHTTSIRPLSRSLSSQVGRDPTFESLASRAPCVNRGEFGRAVRELGFSGELLGRADVDGLFSELVRVDDCGTASKAMYCKLPAGFVERCSVACRSACNGSNGHS